ncbi:hypothetical protein PC121_g22347 [Phytophthora cactorum]|nr:hypothetical protein PC120_g23665 [Phytophthora cactorum]KAG3043757.1 hypothetical protein PC121_g22347 [Phytophthora cactorum]KAG4039915.1 hypothetical protein PC123_g24541 [Phytophthora cactorum]
MMIKRQACPLRPTAANCGAHYAEDKVVQHTVYETIKINGLFADEFGLSLARGAHAEASR